ncbi:hypothetical protein B0J18DRAFT_411444 [Chaetomium sp. MPI-SDFR-AT-0129]|nr:hypothetical protein B0J18DRAFT_411444 [Chaetomium sp. MPI-SDFR-AT-0129]
MADPLGPLDSRDNPLIGLPIEGPLDDEPLQPPPSVLLAIPPFHLHQGDHCCSHNHDFSGPVFAAHIQPRKQEQNGPYTNPHENLLLPCTDCHVSTPSHKLHDLPCGDVLCRLCLVARVAHVQKRIAQNHTEIQRLSHKIHHIDRYLRTIQTTNPLTGDRQKRYLAHRQFYHRTIARLAGLTCCHSVRDVETKTEAETEAEIDISQTLHRYQSCLGTTVSRNLWLLLNWLGDLPTGQRVCAWPDCGAYLPDCCRYQMADSTGSR